jgi:radical SAM enzyme (TIGR01210 family)
VLERRSRRPSHDPWRSQNVIVEDERTEAGEIARTATVFLTGAECPWRCVMCDLWRFTTTSPTPRGAIGAQLGAARRLLDSEPGGIHRLKLYNAGSFFDPRAVPEDDYEEIAARLSGLAHIIVESHPRLIGARVDRLLAALDGARGGGAVTSLEVAMGLETAHPEALERLHKRMTVDDFASAAGALNRRGVAVRSFLLVAPPFVPRDQQDAWLGRSIDAAFSCGVSAVSLVPTRPGNGALEALAADGAFHPPRLADIERAAVAGLARTPGRGRLFVDLWDLERFAECPACFEARRARLQAMNLEQRALPAPPCDACGGPPA